MFEEFRPGKRSFALLDLARDLLEFKKRKAKADGNSALLSREIQLTGIGDPQELADASNELSELSSQIKNLDQAVNYWEGQDVVFSPQDSEKN